MEQQNQNPKPENLDMLIQDLNYAKDIMYHLNRVLYQVADHCYYCAEDVVKMAMASVKELVFDMQKKIEKEGKEA